MEFPQWGNCCIRQYNTQHTAKFHAAVDANITDKLNFSGVCDMIRLELMEQLQVHKEELM
jgi:hypothetical protein